MDTIASDFSVFLYLGGNFTLYGYYIHLFKCTNFQILSIEIRFAENFTVPGFILHEHFRDFLITPTHFSLRRSPRRR